MVPSNTNYRSDIDGLRAVAVLSVILFHIDKSLLPGGFVGVDIFFVISGYLITFQILKDLNRKSFSIIEFYRRRVKRIVPVMLFIVFVTVFIAQFVMRPNDAEKVAESGLWALFSLSNVYFWLFEDTSYFAAASNEKPLLHLWSLGVEEQFYIFWPLILLLVHRLASWKKLFILFSVIAGASFILGEVLFNDDPSFVYYMLPTRAGELLLGALLAQYIFNNSKLVTSQHSISILSFSGLGLIIGSLFLLSEDEVFPGLRAIPPTLGAVFLILSGHLGESIPTKLLKMKVMVWVGLISYSAYLWHWPILAFFHYGKLEITLLSGVIIFAVTILLAWLSYLWIETPTRYLKLTTVQTFFKLLVIPSALVASFIVISMKIDGYGLRWFSDEYKAELATVNDAIKPAYAYDYVCQSNLISQEDIVNTNCILGKGSDAEPEVILWGDSNAAHYIGAIGSFAEISNFRFRNLQVGACPPIFEDPSSYVRIKRVENCRASQHLINDVILKYKVIIVSANWTDYQAKSKEFIDSFFKTALQLSSLGKEVIIIGKAPVITTYDRLCREKAISFPYIVCEASDVKLTEEIESTNGMLNAFAMSNDHIEYYDFNEYLCPNKVCSVRDEHGGIMYYDSSHLSLAASWSLGNKVQSKDGVPYPFNKINSWLDNTK